MSAHAPRRQAHKKTRQVRRSIPVPASARLVAGQCTCARHSAAQTYCEDTAPAAAPSGRACWRALPHHRGRSHCLRADTSHSCSHKTREKIRLAPSRAIRTLLATPRQMQAHKRRLQQSKRTTHIQNMQLRQLAEHARKLNHAFGVNCIVCTHTRPIRKPTQQAACQTPAPAQPLPSRPSCPVPLRDSIRSCASWQSARQSAVALWVSIALPARARTQTHSRRRQTPPPTRTQDASAPQFVQRSTHVRTVKPKHPQQRKLAEHEGKRGDTFGTNVIA